MVYTMTNNGKKSIALSAFKGIHPLLNDKIKYRMETVRKCNVVWIGRLIDLISK